MHLLGDMMQNIAIVGLLVTVYQLKKVAVIQQEVIRILCKWAISER